MSLFLLACQSNKSEGPSHPVSSGPIIYVNGDPKELVADSDLNDQSFITVKSMNQFSGYKFQTLFAFINQQELNTAEQAMSQEELVRLRKAAEKNVLAYAPIYFWKDHGNGEYSFGPDLSAFDPRFIYKNNLFQFHFKKQPNDSLKLTSISVVISKDEISPKELVDDLHYSINGSGDTFSLLFSYEASGTKILFSYYFRRDSTWGEPVDYPWRAELEPFKLIFGPKMDVHWDQKKPVEFTICGVKNTNAVSGIVASVDTWKAALEGRLDLLTKVKERCPPFSDLGGATIRVTSKYKLLRTSAFALVVPGPPARGIVDGDIFVIADLSEEALNSLKASATDIQRGFLLVTAHEVGHVLGLQHQSDQASIMNYNWDYLKTTNNLLTPYDVNAIQTLYPLKSKPEAVPKL